MRRRLLMDDVWAIAVFVIVMFFIMLSTLEGD